MDAAARPLTLGELLDSTFSLYRARFWWFISILAWPRVLLGAMGLVQLMLAANVSPVQGAKPTPAQVAMVFLGTFLPAVIVVVAGAVAFTITAAAVTQQVFCIAGPGAMPARAIYATLKGKYGRLLGTTAVLMLLGIGVVGIVIVIAAAVAATGVAVAPDSTIIAMVLVLLVFLVFAGMAVFLLRYGLCIPVIVIENLGVFEALKRSSVLTRGYRRRVLMTWVLMYLINVTIELIVNLPYIGFGVRSVMEGGEIPSWVAGQSLVAGCAGSLLVGPLFPIALTLLYRDLRVRKEGLDLREMLDALPLMPLPAVPGSLA